MSPCTPATGVQHPTLTQYTPFFREVCHPTPATLGFLPKGPQSHILSYIIGVTQLPLPHGGVPSCTMKAYQNRSHRLATSPGLFLSARLTTIAGPGPPLLPYLPSILLVYVWVPIVYLFPLTVSATDPRHSLRLGKCSTIDR